MLNDQKQDYNIASSQVKELEVS